MSPTPPHLNDERETGVLNKQPNKADKHGDTVVKRASRKHDDDEHGGAWKVAFADFCLALMCLFLVLWVMAARQQERIQEVMRAPGGNVMDEGQGIMPETLGGPRGSMIAHEPLPRQGDTNNNGRSFAHGEDEPHEPGKGPFTPRVRYETPGDLANLSQVLARLSVDSGLAGNLQAIVTPYGLRVMLHDTDKQGMFERGSAVASERFRTLLRQMGPVFAQMDNQMLIVGHTDSLQYADRSHAAFSNWTLSSNRAMSARAQLLAGGMNTASVLQVVGMADRAPVDAKNAAAGVNRRIELLILTRAQAQSVAAMFGMPKDVVPLTDGVDAEIPDHAAMKTLKDQMVASRGRGAEVK